ncbi:response regulator transcription factor [Poseidonibacter antarcticus]|uniref:response regulator transcription factor n=1 Tax=Poseidonibacter antarcticus TaxID=2478538 RepID=UPI000EF475FC|nr:response regulator transcription factor [Poseidonibacter antarcticus]
MSLNVVIIEDDIQLNLVLSEYFTMKDFKTICIHDGMEAIELIENICAYKVNLYIIDINLPSFNGLDILKYIRKTDIHTPIIIITASLEIQNFTDAFDFGCSEYIKKPFHIKELEVRINKLMNNDIKIIHFSDNFYYNEDNKSFLYENEIIELRFKEQRLIEILFQNANKLVPTEIIHDYVWEGEIRELYPLRQLLTDIRKKLPMDIITTKVKQGYIINTKKYKH